MNVRCKYSSIPEVESDWQDINLTDFVIKLPIIGLLIVEGGMFPPLNIFNEFLLKEEVDAGMSGMCQWKPFQINAEEYELLIENLENRLVRKIISNDQLQRANTFEKWYSTALTVYSKSKK